MAGIKGKGGQKGRSGRKSKAEELGLQQLLDECWSDPARKTVIRKLACDAKSKDFHVRNESRKLLLAYTFGKPTERAEIAQSNFDYSNADLSALNDYELERLIAGDDPRSIFAASSKRLIREKAKAG